MLIFDSATIQRLKKSDVKTEDKLYLFVRYIEEKYQFKTMPNHWEDKFGGMEKNERVFYKLWLWIFYAEWESLVKPISEFDPVYGSKMKMQLIEYLDDQNEDSEDTFEQFFTLDGQAGKILLDWAFKNVKTNYVG